MKFNRRAALLAAASFAVGLSISAAYAQDGEPIKVGFIDPLTGPAARIGKENLDGVNYALDEVGGKIGNRPIQLIMADDQNSPNVGLTETRRLVESEKVVAVIGTLNSAVALAIHPYTTRAQMPYITGGIAADLTGARKSPFTFRASAAAGQMEVSLATFLVRRGWKTGLLMGSDYAAGRDAVAAVGTNLKALGGTVAEEVFPRQGETDYAPFFSRIADKKADFVYGYFFGGDTLRYVRGYKTSGLKQPLVITPSALSAAGVAQALGENVNGVLSLELWIWTLEDPVTKAFVEGFKKKFGGVPQTLAYDGYIKGRVLIEALKSLNGKVESGAALAAAMKKVKFAAPGGQFQFDDNNNPIINTYFVEWSWANNEAVPKVLATIPGVKQGDTPKP